VTAFDARVPSIFAHRGAHDVVPENSIAAFERAMSLGADGVELDVRMCRTGELVVYHDRDLWRMTGQPGDVATSSWADLARREVAPGHGLAVLHDVLDAIVSRGFINIEVKGDGPERLLAARTVVSEVGRRSPADRAKLLYSTFSPLVHLVLRREGRGVPVGFLFDATHTGPRRGPLVARALRAEGVHPHHPMATPSAVAKWKQRGVFVNVWTVNDPARAVELAESGVDGLITDDVPALRAALAPRLSRVR
jgi:glycerophosphoryl diester phosphodiesterase